MRSDAAVRAAQREFDSQPNGATALNLIRALIRIGADGQQLLSVADCANDSVNDLRAAYEIETLLNPVVGTHLLDALYEHSYRRSSPAGRGEPGTIEALAEDIAAEGFAADYATGFGESADLIEWGHGPSSFRSQALEDGEIGLVAWLSIGRLTGTIIEQNDQGFVSFTHWVHERSMRDAWELIQARLEGEVEGEGQIERYDPDTDYLYRDGPSGDYDPDTDYLYRDGPFGDYIVVRLGMPAQASLVGVGPTVTEAAADLRPNNSGLQSALGHRVVAESVVDDIDELINVDDLEIEIDVASTEPLGGY